jgi:ATP-dependent DNA ligase
MATEGCCRSPGGLLDSVQTGERPQALLGALPTGSGRSCRSRRLLDGEVVALDGEGRQNFRDLMAGRGNLHYAAFDALWIDGKDLRPLLLTRRKQFLTRLIPDTTTVLSQVFTIAERGRDLFAAVERLDLEGIVAKGKTDPYRPETVWYKIKSRTYTQGDGRWELFQKRHP